MFLCIDRLCICTLDERIRRRLFQVNKNALMRAQLSICDQNDLENERVFAGKTQQPRGPGPPKSHTPQGTIRPRAVRGRIVIGARDQKLRRQTGRNRQKSVGFLRICQVCPSQRVGHARAKAHGQTRVSFFELKRRKRSRASPPRARGGRLR